MCATRPRTMGSTGSGRSRLWLLALVLLAGGALVQACTDNKGGGGPFPTGQTGHADTPSEMIVRVGVNPNRVELNRRAGITVLVTNFNGRALPGRHVQLSTSADRLQVLVDGALLDQVDGFTDIDGKFVAFLFCDPAVGGVTATITAFVEGAVGTGTVICGSGGVTPTGTGEGEPPAPAKKS